MQLVFIHGWAFDAHFWNALSAQLAPFKQKHVNLGFFGDPTDITPDNEKNILIGHSLGFLHGMNRKKNWAACIAINAFPNFVITNGIGCATAATLRAMRKQLATDAAYTLDSFYRLINAPPQNHSQINSELLQQGLDELRDGKIEQTITPCLVLAAQNDPLVPTATSEALAHKAELAWHATGGHLLPQTATTWCANAITSFIGRHFP